jgi:large subunit ribosomal protein L25
MHIKIEAQPREIGKKSDLNKLRSEGFIPAIIYGEGKPGINIKLPVNDFLKNYKKSIGEVSIFDIHVKGKKYSTFIRDKQINPVSREFVHIDFVELHKGKPITMDIPFKFIGEPKGAHEGGVVEYLHRTIEISCLPKDLPEEIEIDITHLRVGDSLHFADISLPENITAHMTDDTTIISVKEARLRVEKKAVEDIAEEDIQEPKTTESSE